MIIGGYKMEDLGYAIIVEEHEAGWKFYLEGDAANQFRDEWEQAQEYDHSFGQFLWDHEYTQLFQ